jgi:hypothetical protein
MKASTVGEYRRSCQAVSSEPERVGLVIDASDTWASIRALPVGNLVEAIFDLSGFSSMLSDGGLIARQLIAQLGGVDRARAFKIPGVRRLLKTYSPTAPFTKKSAVQLIGCEDPDNPDASFKDHENLYIEPRHGDTKLTPAADALPRKRFETFIVLAKLCPFTADEIALAKTLNDKYRRRAILLTARELEPYHFFDRTKLEFKGIDPYADSAEDLARATDLMYFEDAPRSATH